MNQMRGRRPDRQSLRRCTVALAVVGLGALGQGCGGSKALTNNMPDSGMTGDASPPETVDAQGGPDGATPDGTACTAPEVKAPGTAERTFGANVGPISQHTGSFLEAEDFIAIFHDDVVVAYNDLATYKIGISNSTDSGGTFATRGGSATASPRYQSDPVVVVDA